MGITIKYFFSKLEIEIINQITYQKFEKKLLIQKLNLYLIKAGNRRVKK